MTPFSKDPRRMPADGSVCVALFLFFSVGPAIGDEPESVGNEAAECGRAASSKKTEWLNVIKRRDAKPDGLDGQAQINHAVPDNVPYMFLDASSTSIASADAGACTLTLVSAAPAPPMSEERVAPNTSAPCDNEPNITIVRLLKDGCWEEIRVSALDLQFSSPSEFELWFTHLSAAMKSDGTREHSDVAVASETDPTADQHLQGQHKATCTSTTQASM